MLVTGLTPAAAAAGASQRLLKYGLAPVNKTAIVPQKAAAYVY